jgi:hypothetical protein
VNIDQLMESLSQNAPDAGDVLASLHRKRRTARNRIYATSGGLAVAVAVVAVVVGALLPGAGTSSGSTAESSPANGIAVPAAAPAGSAGFTPGAASSDNSGSAAACGAVRLQANLAEAVRKGASVIVGYGTLTSGSAAVQGAASNGPAYYSLTLRSVQTLAGPTVTTGSIAWIAGPSPAAGASALSGTASARPRTFAPGGELFGIVSPSGASGTPGPVLQAAPISDGQVLLSGAGCWDITASGSPQGIVFGTSLGPARAALPPADGMTKVPLATAEKLAAQAG